MLRRTERGDTEGYYRLHWVLTDSLSIYYDLRGEYYFGPKKALRRMANTAPDDAAVYERAPARAIAGKSRRVGRCIEETFFPEIPAVRNRKRR